MKRWTRRLRVALCWLALTTPAAALAGPLGDIKDRAPRALLLDVGPGLGWQIAPALPHRMDELGHTNGGFGVAAGLRLRTRYFLSPFVDLTYTPVYENRQMDRDSGGVRTSTSSMLGIAFGPSIEIWRVRVAGGIALDQVHVRSSTADHALDVRPWYQGYSLTAAGTVLHRRRWDLGLEARLLAVTEADLVLLTVNLALAADLFTF